MKNQQIAKVFNEIAELLELKGENVFRIRAYRRAAQNLDGLSKDVSALSDDELAAILLLEGLQATFSSGSWFFR